MTPPTPPARPAPPVATMPLPLPQPEDQAAHIESAHLFGAALFGDAAPAGIQPVPVVSLGGVDVASAPDSSLTFPMVVDGIHVTWGRSEALAQPDPPAASFAIFDPSGVWAVGRELIGQLVTIRWVATKPGDPAPSSGVFFVGRITGAKLTRKTVTRSDGVKMHGAQVALSAASILTDLANITPTGDWPEETLGARSARIAAAASNVVSSLAVAAFWQAPNVAPVAAGDQVSLLEHLIALYDAAGPNRYSFLPATHAVVSIGRRDWPSNRTLAGLTWNAAGEGTPRDGKGAYVCGFGADADPAGLPAVPLYLDGEAIEYAFSAALTKDITSRITRVEVAHTDSGSTPPYADVVESQLVSAIDPTVNEVTMGVRTARQDSQLVWNSYAAVAASDLAYMAAREASGWRADPITVRPALSGGFETWAQMTQLLAGTEQQSMVFLQRSWFAQLGIRPIFGLIGGKISYVGGEWLCECELLPANTLPMAQHQLSWSEIDDGSATYQLEWWDDDNPRGLHESLTYEDMAFVGRGLGMTDPPADTYGWDRTYP
jgi:hypothetical protein